MDGAHISTKLPQALHLRTQNAAMAAAVVSFHHRNSFLTTQNVALQERRLCCRQYQCAVRLKPFFSGRPRHGIARRQARRIQGHAECLNSEQQPLVIGVAADSGCGKSTCTRRICSIFGGTATPPNGATNSNTLISDMVTLICLDDYHLLDREGRKRMGLTALNPEANNFDLMYEQIKALKEGSAVYKPIYNHETGTIDAPERIEPPKILLLDGLHPLYDPRVRSLLDFSVYLDISNPVKYAWKIQRDCKERNESEEAVRASIAKREPDFKQFIDPQKEMADIVMEVLPTQLIEKDEEFKVLRVRMVMREDNRYFTPVYLIDEGSTVIWTPCGTKLTCPYPGIRFMYGPDVWYDHPVSVLEIDGQFDDPGQLLYVEKFLLNTSAKYLGEVRDQMVRNASYPGSHNGTGFFQTLIALKIREVYEKRAACIFPSVMTPAESTW